MNLVLIGLRGSGKSTVGRILAERLNREFYDTDSIVQERAGKTIREIFDESGEAGFRKLESEIVLECATKTDAVIATGGGAILNPANADALKRGGFVAHLSAEPHVLWHRVSHDAKSHSSRPKLLANAESGIDELKKLMLSRAGAYAHARHVEVDVEDRSPEEIAEAILLLMRVHGIDAADSAKTETSPL